MKHASCTHCAFSLAFAERWCPNCGLFLMLHVWRFALAGGLAGTAGGVLLCVWWAASVWTGPHSATQLGIAFITDGVLGAVLGVVLAGGVQRGMALLLRTEHCLQEQERRLALRLRESEESLVRLSSVRDRLRHEGDSWQDVREVLSTAQGTYLRQRDRIRLQLWDVELLRAMNRIQAAAQGWSELTETATETRIESLVAERDRLNALQNELRGLDQAPPEELQIRRTRLAPAMELSERLRQALLAREVSRTLATIRPLNEPGHPESGEALQRELECGFEILSVRTGLKELAESFVALEQEQLRLQAELEVAGVTLPAR